MSNEEYTAIKKENMAEETETKAGLKIVEEDAFEKKQVSNEELAQFYKENEDAIDLIGGLDMFESLMNLSDEEFLTLKPQIAGLFESALNEPVYEKEMRLLVLSEDYDSNRLKEDVSKALEAIDLIDFLSENKKDFLKEIYLNSANKLQEIINSSDKIIHIPCELEEGASLPTYAHKTDAGVDIYAREEITINPGETIIVPTGIKCAIPEGYALLIQPRSGQSAKTKLRIANSPGLIDSGYRDEIGVIVENIEPPFKDIDYEFDDNGKIQINSILHGNSYTIVEGQRFAQMRLVQVPKAEFIKVESVGEIGEDRNGGFGSSGI